MKLNDKQIKRLIKEGLPGKHSLGNNLYLRISDEGTATWVFRFKMSKNSSKRPEMTIGNYSSMSLAQAWSEALRLKAEIKEGENPLAEKHRLKNEPCQTVNELAEEWLRRNDTRVKHPHIQRRIYNKEIAPFIGLMNLSKVKPRDIRAIIEKIAESGRPTIANDALFLCKSIFRYGVKLEVITDNPANAFDVNDAGGKEEGRSRFLTQEEVQILFDVFRQNAGQISREIYLMTALEILFSGRKGELIKARWSEIDLKERTWFIPAGNTKTKAEIVVPLSGLAVEILEELKVRAYGSDYVFPAKKANSKNPHLNLSTINAAINKLFEQGKIPLEHFTVHDLRRTSRTLMSQQKVLREIAERCLNHKIKGVEGIYDRWSYFDERKEAQEKLAVILRPIVMQHHPIQ